MKKSKRIVAIALTAALAASLTACSGKQDAAAAIQAATKKMNAVKSMDAIMTMDMDISAAGESMTISTTMDMTSFSDPAKIRADISVDMGVLGSLDMTMYAEESDGNYTLYTGIDGQWESQTVTAEEFGQYDAQSSMNLYLDSADEFAFAGTEDLASGTSDKYTGLIKGESLEKVLLASGALSSIGSFGIGADTEELFSDLGDIPVTVWVDQTSGYPVRYEMNMSEVMQKIMAKAMETTGSDEAQDMSVSVITTLECSNFDNTTDFTIPAEALAAASSVPSSNK